WSCYLFALLGAGLGCTGLRRCGLLRLRVDAGFLTLLRGDLARRIRQWVHTAAGLREGDDVPDGVEATQQADDSVPTERDAAVWRSAEGEGVEQEAELLAGLLLGDSHDLEHALLDVPLVDTDGTAADLIAVADDVVGVGQRGTRVLVKGVQELRLRGGKGVLHGSPCGVAEGHVTLCAGVGCRLEHRRVNDPGEGPLVVVNESQLLGNLAACRTQQAAGRLGVTGCEEDAVARLRADVIGDTSALIISDVLCNWTGQLAVLAHQDVGQALCTALLGPLLPGVELAAWLAGSTIHDDGTDVLVLEHAEGRVLEELGALGDLNVEAQIRLIGAVEPHRVGVGHARKWGLDLVASGGPYLGEDLLGQGDDVLLVDEAHLDVQLRELWLAVCAEVLVPVAAGDLDLNVEAQIRLIGAVEPHRVGVGHARKWGLDLVASGGPYLGEDLLGQGDDVLLVDEAHLDVQLRELWLAVCAEVLVPVAAGD